MKILILLITALFSSMAFAGNCTALTRTNYTSFQVLGSTQLNTDFNNIVAKINNLDGGCITDGTLEFAALDATDFSSVANGIQQGCTLNFINSNTVAVDKCLASVNGKNIRTTVATNVTWGCSGCSSEASATQYYVYIKNGSSGTTLNLLISTTAPNADGYDVGSNKAVGKFYNDAISDIQAASLYSWVVNGFRAYGSNGLNYPIDTFYFNYGASGLVTPCSSGVCSNSQIGNYLTSMTWTSTGHYDLVFARKYTLIMCNGSTQVSSVPGFLVASSLRAINTNTLSIITKAASSPYNDNDTYGVISCQGY